MNRRKTFRLAKSIFALALSVIIIVIGIPRYSILSHAEPSVSGNGTSEITGISIESKSITYDGSNHQLVTLQGDFESGDTVTWTVNGVTTDSESVPEASAEGEYEITLCVSRAECYDYIQTVNSTISFPTISTYGLVVSGYDGTYDGQAHSAVNVSGNTGSYTLKYQIADDEGGYDESGWTSTVPQVTNAGSYIVWVKAVENNHQDTEVPVEPASHSVSPFNVYIAKASQSFSFDNYSGSESQISLTASQMESGVVRNFSATDTEAKAGGTISYSIETDDSDIAEIDSSTGSLTIYGGGRITVKAVLSGDANYNSCEIEHVLNVIATYSSQGEWLSFPNYMISYTLGATEGIPNNSAEKTFRWDWSDITYNISNGNEIGLSVDSSGRVRISNYDKLVSALDENNGQINVSVTATKSALFFWAYQISPEDSVSYTLRISMADVPDSPYTFYSVDDDETQLTSANGENGWYNTALIVKPADGYQIIKAEDMNGTNPSFSSAVRFGEDENGNPDDQGSSTINCVYLREIATGEITRKITLTNIRIDTVAPGNLNVIFPVASVHDDVSYFGDVVSIRFEAHDISSGVDYFEWEYTRENGVSESNLAIDSGNVTAHLDDEAFGDGYYYGELTLPEEEAEQLRGNIRIVAVDEAGNRSEICSDTGVFVVDTIAPRCTVTYGAESGNGTGRLMEGNYYFSGEVVFTIKIVETNFYGGDVYVSLSKNGVSTVVRNLTWEETGVQDEYKAVLHLSEDGQYVVSIDYTDRSGKEMTSYRSENIVIDTSAPVLNNASFSTPDRSANGVDYYKGNLTVQFDITEFNFFEEDVHVALKSGDSTSKEITASWTHVSGDTYRGAVTIAASGDHSHDGEYVFSITYTDRSGNEMNEYVSAKKVIDTKKPVISVKYDIATPVCTAADVENNQRKYYNTRLTATVTINERNFDASDVKYLIEAKDVTGASLNASSLYSVSGWSRSGDENTIVITYPGDANYSFNISYVDMATNQADEYSTDFFTVDTTPPTDLKVIYSSPVTDNVMPPFNHNYYNGSATLTISATDNISGVNFIQYSLLKAEPVSPINAERSGVIVDASGMTLSDGGRTGTVQVEIPGNILGHGSQFNGNILFFATDRAGNDSVTLTDDKRIIVDSISPTVNLTYNAPVQEKGGVLYYGGNINLSISVNEANFYKDDINVSVIKDEIAQNTNVNWTDNSTDIHVGTFSLTEDGDYKILIDYTDRSGNVMQSYISGQLTIDTVIKEANITINGLDADGIAYKDEVFPSIVFEDENLDSYELTLFRTDYSAKNIDVTENFVEEAANSSENSISIDLKSFDRIQDNDGIYVLYTKLSDKSGNIAEKSITFTVNRFGSVYEYNDYLLSLIVDGGAFVQGITEDLVISEYNADKLLGDSLDIEISKDGKPLDAVIYSVSPTIDESVKVGERGWYQYTYTIDRTNFASDGVYKISVSSQDATGNRPENSNYADKMIVFRVDSTVPEITSISGLEKKIVNATDQEIRYTIYDTIGLASILVYVDGEIICNESDFSDDPNNFNGSFTLHESSNARKVNFVVTDKAGNVTDTNSEQFTSAYSFNPEITVSTNFFVRWFANKGLFVGTLVGGFALVGYAVMLIVRVSKKRRFGEK